LQVPPDELIYSDDEDTSKAAAIAIKKLEKAAKVSVTQQAAVEEDTMSDLAGSDHEDEEFDVEVVDEEDEEEGDGDEYDFDAMEVEETNDIVADEDDDDEEVEVKLSHKRKSSIVVAKKTKKPKSSKETEAKPRATGLQKKPAVAVKEKLHSKTASMLKNSGRRS
jgi:hypothetical protein